MRARLRALALLLAAGVTPIAFTEVRDPRDWPPAVREWVRDHRASGGTGAVHDGAHTYLLAAAGERRTGGYALRFTEVVESEGRIAAVAVLTEPPPGGVVTMALSYPLAVARVARTSLPVVIEQRAGPAG